MKLSLDTPKINILLQHLDITAWAALLDYNLHPL